MPTERYKYKYYKSKKKNAIRLLNIINNKHYYLLVYFIKYLTFKIMKCKRCNKTTLEYILITAKN